ncbi:MULTISPECIES: alpha/beta fold hydrolase [Streptosporangium]|uniref:Pimeloyl-ACP methyl ester carboxylesterase n=1 Tax=Streptosporangium brasiliense TaxID=47480 RepID=A0ABT9R6C5_9ACTN|nr:alpha/beta hydrolase [Streptosporangium brasiliense]MDP9864795.1 pimeloyl-ACP methyl ester carboxylesterase [Streptosporangium brasiliense]
MEPTKTDILKVPGAELYYEVCGSGPVLLLICGGIYDAAGYAGLAERLAGRYTVVTYDRRGNSRSPLAGAPERQSIEVHGDDAHRVLTAVGVTADEPAYVFGNSSGAVIGLELAARHPEQVRALVAHEPPVLGLLPDRDHWHAVIQEVEDTFLKEGAGPAMQVFATGMGMGGEPAQGDGGEPAQGDGSEPARGDAAAQAPQGDAAQASREEPALETAEGPDPEMMGMMARMERNMQFFIGYEVPPFIGYAPDIAALQASSARVVLAVGGASAGEPPYRASFAVAERLGTLPVVFPGDHGGFGAQPEEFAAKLHEVISNP